MGTNEKNNDLSIHKKDITIKDIPMIFDTLDIGTPLIVGDSGIGKTQRISEEAIARDYELIPIDASTLNPEELYLPKEIEGYLTFILNKHFAPGPKQKLVFIDEINRGNVSVRRALITMVNEKRLGAVDLSHLKFIAACNPNTEEYADTEEITDKAFIRRFDWYHLHFDLDQFVSYLFDKNYNKEIIEFIIDCCAKFDNKNVLGEKNCPRAWEKICKYVRKKDGKIEDPSKLKAMFNFYGNAVLDRATVATFEAFVDSGMKMIKLREVLEGKIKKVPDKPLDILLLKNEIKLLNSWNPKEEKHLVSFIERMNRTLAYQFMLDIAAYNPNLSTKLMEYNSILEKTVQ